MPSAVTGAEIRSRRPARYAAVVSLYARFARIVHEMGKFGVVGAICYVLDVAVFNLCLVGAGLAWLPSLMISTLVATSLAFVGNRFWTWRDRERTALHREYARYVGFNIIGLLIGAGVLWLSHDVAGAVVPAFQTALADNIAGKIVGVGLASTFRFWAYRRFVFRPAPPRPHPAPVD